MSQRYNLNKLLKEIEEDEALDGNPRNIRVSQEDILRMVENKRKNKKAGDQ